MKGVNGKEGPLIKTSFYNGVKNYQWMPDNVKSSDESVDGLIP